MIYLNQIVVIIFLGLVISCNDVSKSEDKRQLPQNSKITEVRLIDSLGTITFSIPSRYDTTFSWVHYSDCGKPCDEQKYRFQSKLLPIIKESTWLWSKPKDSIERITISHKKDFPFRDGDTARNLIKHERIKEKLISNPENSPMIFDTIQKINGRYFSIYEMAKSGLLQSRIVIAVATIKNNDIFFQYELLTRKKDSITTNFIKNSIDLIKTIHIEKGM